MRTLSRWPSRSPLIYVLRAGRTISRPDWERTENERRLCKALEEVAQQVGAKSIQAVAIAYVMQKTPYVFPIIGCRKIEQLQANIEALGVALSPEQIKYLEDVLPFEKGFPHGMVVSRVAFCLRVGEEGADLLRVG